MKNKITSAIILAALILGQSAFAKPEEKGGQLLSDTIIDGIVFIGAGRIAWEIWWRWIDRTPRPQRPTP